MRLGRHEAEDNQDYEEITQDAAESTEQIAGADAEVTQDYEEVTEPQGRSGRRGRRAKNKDGNEDGTVDLSKLKKRDLLEIMLRQGEEIDSLRAQVAELEARLEDKNFKLNKVGSIAEASLAVTKIFEEAEKAAMIYLENIRSKVQ